MDTPNTPPPVSNEEKKIQVGKILDLYRETIGKAIDAGADRELNALELVTYTAEVYYQRALAQTYQKMYTDKAKAIADQMKEPEQLELPLEDAAPAPSNVIQFPNLPQK